MPSPKKPLLTNEVLSIIVNYAGPLFDVPPASIVAKKRISEKSAHARFASVWVAYHLTLWSSRQVLGGLFNRTEEWTFQAIRSCEELCENKDYRAKVTALKDAVKTEFLSGQAHNFEI